MWQTMYVCTVVDVLTNFKGFGTRKTIITNIKTNEKRDAT